MVIPFKITKRILIIRLISSVAFWKGLKEKFGFLADAYVMRYFYYDSGKERETSMAVLSLFFIHPQ